MFRPAEQRSARGAGRVRTNEYSSECKRQGDVYVFCLFTATDRASADPLDVCQWQFLVASTALLNERFPEHKSLSVSTLRKAAGVVQCGFSDIKAAVSAAAPASPNDVGAPSGSL
ncbi:hypothetical protein [Gordonia iterans]